MSKMRLPPIAVLRDHGLADISEVIEHIYGPRCPDYDSGCMTCRAWEALDTIEKLTDELGDE